MARRQETGWGAKKLQVILRDEQEVADLDLERDHAIGKRQQRAERIAGLHLDQAEFQHDQERDQEKYQQAFFYAAVTG